MSIEALALLHVGSVETCSPIEIKILLDSAAPQDVAFNTGRPQGFPRLNGYVVIPNEQGAVVAVIARMSMEPSPTPASVEQRMHQLPPRRRLYVTPLGTLETSRVRGTTTYKLRRGVASYPAVGDSVVLATAEQLLSIVQATGADARVRIGTSRLALDAPVTIDPDKLFGRHLGVFGNTGSGKSCTVAGLVRWSVEATAREGASAARFVILDPNGEYRRCFNDLRALVDVKVFSVEPDAGETRIQLPGWMWNGDEWAGALEASPGTQRPILMQAIRHLRAAHLQGVDIAAPGVAAGETDKVVLATKVRAFADYVVAQQVQGQAHLVRFPVLRQLHQSFSGLAELTQRHMERLGPDDHAVSAAIERASEKANEIVERRTHGAHINHFEDGDLQELVDELRALQALLPEPLVLHGPSEDLPSPFDVRRLPEMISVLGELQGAAVQQHLAGLDLRLKTLLADPRIAPIIAANDPDLTLEGWLHDLLGTGARGRGQITVFDLSLVPTDVRTTLVAVLGRLTFETAQRFRRQHGGLMPMVLVLEEAHNFLQRQSADLTDTSSAVRCRHTFEKIAKEGRKFGVGLVVSSQRPAELSPTTVAQCNSFVLHRIVNDRDQELVSRLAPDTSGSLLKELPSLPTQQAILMGLAAEIPLVFDVRLLAEEHRPNSENPKFWDAWSGVSPVAHDLSDTVRTWVQ